MFKDIVIKIRLLLMKSLNEVVNLANSPLFVAQNSNYCHTILYLEAREMGDETRNNIVYPIIFAYKAEQLLISSSNVSGAKVPEHSNNLP